MSNQAESPNISDLFDPWGIMRQMRDTWLESTAKSMIDYVNTEEYSKSTGTMLNAYMDFAEPVRAWTDAVMPHLLAHSGLPSRKELMSVAARMTSIEMRLDDMEVAIQEICRAVCQPANAPVCFRDESRQKAA